MKILYLSKGDHIDYLDDCLMIGLKELLGPDLVDVNKRDHVYTSYDESKVIGMYGKGMTITRVIPDLNVDRSDITLKIKNKVFDYIVYGSIWRFNNYIDQILEYYPKDRVIAVDGEDWTTLNAAYNYGIRYYKREIDQYIHKVNPISFAIPTVKFNPSKVKERDFALIIPGDMSTYIYNKEEDYYRDYKISRFGHTCKKAGWDCMRHYEILGNGCIPFFRDLENCPAQTLVNFPKDELIKVKQRLDNNEQANIVFEDSYEFIVNHTQRNNTTLVLAKRFIDSLND
jgi:hypothetical protein